MSEKNIWGHAIPWIADGDIAYPQYLNMSDDIFVDQPARQAGNVDWDNDFHFCLRADHFKYTILRDVENNGMKPTPSLVNVLNHLDDSGDPIPSDFDPKKKVLALDGTYRFMNEDAYFASHSYWRFGRFAKDIVGYHSKFILKLTDEEIASINDIGIF